MNLEYVISRCRHAASEPSAEFVVSGLVAGELAALLEDTASRLESAQSRIEWLIDQNDVESADAAKARAERDAIASRLDEREKQLGECTAGYETLVKERRLATEEIQRERDRADELASRLDALLKAAERDIADAKHICGGDGEGCETYRGYYETAERRHQKCSSCPMGALSNIREVVAVVEPRKPCPHPTWLPFASEDVEYCAMCGEERERVVERLDKNG